MWCIVLSIHLEDRPLQVLLYNQINSEEEATALVDSIFGNALGKWESDPNFAGSFARIGKCDVIVYPYKEV